MIDLRITGNLDRMDNIFKKLLLFSHTIHTDYRFPPSTPPSFPKHIFFLRSILFPSPCFQKRADLPGTSTKYDTKRYNKTRQKVLHQGWGKHLN